MCKFLCLKIRYNNEMLSFFTVSNKKNRNKMSFLSPLSLYLQTPLYNDTKTQKYNSKTKKIIFQ